MGEDAVSPYYPFLEKGKGVFALVKTSNPSGKDFQDLMVGSETLYERTAKKVSEWGERFIGKSGFSAIGAVTGLTYPEEFERIRPLLTHTFLLDPRLWRAGRNRQGYRGVFPAGVRGVVNSSRGIITAHKGKCEDARFVDHVRAAALDMKKDILQHL